MINLQLNHTTLFSCMKPQNQNMDLFIYFLTLEKQCKTTIERYIVIHIHFNYDVLFI